MLRSLFTCLILLFVENTFAQLSVSPDKDHLVTKSGKPFFWLGDTAWELFHRLSREEADEYLENRARKGFTVIQAVVLAELDGLRVPNYYGDLPLIGEDPARPNEAYFKHVDYVVRKANGLGLVIAMLPSWGDKWNKKWGVGPEVFNTKNAALFGEYVGRRYRDKNIVWVLGGDRDCEEPQDYEILRAMAAGLKKGDGGKHLMTFHPQGGKSSSDFFKEDDWIDFHMSQTGHSQQSRNYLFTIKHKQMVPRKPHLDGEPRYEDHPNDFNPVKNGWMDDVDARQCAYWSVMAGAFGHTYGNHNIWQFYTFGRAPVSWARTNWKTALDHPGAYQMGIMKRLFESRNWTNMRMNNSLIVNSNPEDQSHMVAAISADSSFIMVYTPLGDSISVNTSALRSDFIQASWFNPRDGELKKLEPFKNIAKAGFRPHSSGRGSDWVLIVDAIAKPR